MPPPTIVAIGGGALSGDLKIERDILKLTGRRSPNALFIPTASSDSEEYARAFQAVFADKLQCNTDILRLLKEVPSKDRIGRRIRWAHLIYVGGGNTLKMMRRWRHLGVDRMLKKAWISGTVLSGSSAGAICWFEHGHSDSMGYYHPSDWNYVRVRGLGFIKALGCPHYDGERRNESFELMVQRTGETGIAIDNDAAVVFKDDRFRVLSARRGARAYRVQRSEAGVTTDVLKPTTQYADAGSLFG